MHPPPFFLPPPKIGFPLRFSLAKKKTYLDTNFKEELTDLFRNITSVFSIPTGKVERGSWTPSLWLALPSHVRDSLEDKSMLAPSKKDFSPRSLAKKRILLGTHLREDLTDFFWKLTWYLFPIPSGRVEN